MVFKFSYLHLHNGQHVMVSNPRRFYQFRLGLAMGLGVASSLLGRGQPAIAQSYCRADLVSRLDAIATQPSLQSAHVGILIETLGRTPSERRTLYTRAADQSFIPASNMKLLTTAAALQRLGPNFRVRTGVYGTVQNGLTSLQIIGKGDPTFAAAQLQDLAQQLASQGINQVPTLTGYDGYFPGAAINPGWEWEDIQAGYGAEINSLMLNENELLLTVAPTAQGQPLQPRWVTSPPPQPWPILNFSRTVAAGQPGSVTIWRDFSQPHFRLYGQLPVNAEPETLSLAIPHPAQYFLQRFQAHLTQVGISVAQINVANGLPPDSLPSELAAVTSPPLAQWLIRANQNSNNQYAEAIFKTLGMALLPTSSDANQAGSTAVATVLTSLGVNVNAVQIADGSGLSRHNLVTPSALVDTLQAMAFVPTADSYRQSLAVAGEVGTLRSRFQGTVVQGQLQGKTGALTNNTTLSGYFDPPHAPPLVFSILVNNHRPSSSTVRDIIDDMVMEVARLNDC